MRRLLILSLLLTLLGSGCSEQDNPNTTAPTPDDMGGTGQDDISEQPDTSSPDMAQPSQDLSEEEEEEPDIPSPDMGHDTENDIADTPDLPENQAPVLVLSSAMRPHMTPRRDFLLEGIVQDEDSTPNVTVHSPAGDVEVEVDAQGAFSQWIPLSPGLNLLDVQARDQEGLQSSQTLEVYFGHRISVGNSQGAYLREDGLHTWGRNELGQLGNGTLQGSGYGEDPETSQWPARYQLPRQRMLSIVTRQTFMIALDEQGQILTWGSNSDGQLGYEAEEDCGSRGNSLCRSTPTQVPDIADAIAVQAGFNHSMVLLQDGTVLTWGSNSDGQLGYASEEETQLTPHTGPRSL